MTTASKSHSPSSLKPTLMIVGAHADDHELCIGGTMAKYHGQGYEIAYVMSTNNMSGSWSRKMPDGSIQSTTPPWHVIRPQRILEAEAAAAELGTKPIYLDHPQRHYVDDEGRKIEVRYGNPKPSCIPEDVPTILTAGHDKPSIRRMADLIHAYAPEAVITHGMPMVNPEHFGTCLLVTEGYRLAESEGYRGMLLYFEDLGVPLLGTYGSLYNRWDTFIDVTDFFEEKIRLSGIHACQKPEPEKLDWPKWGPICHCGHAEVFDIVSEHSKEIRYGKFGQEILAHAKQGPYIENP